MIRLAHRVIRMLPAKWQSSIEQESRDWVMRCPCGSETSIWDMGGVRFKAAGNPVRSGRCGACGQIFFGQVYRRGSKPGSDQALHDTRSDSSTTLPLAVENLPDTAQASGPATPGGMLWIDGVGVFRILGESRVTIGSHASEGSGADIQLLAPLNRREAAIVRRGEGYWLESLETVSGAPQAPRLVRSGDVLDLGHGVRLRLCIPNPLSTTATLEFVSPHRPMQRLDGLVLLEEVCILGPGEDAHVRCPHWRRPLVIFRRQDHLWCHGTGLSLNGASEGTEFPLTSGAVITGDDLRLRVELSCG